MYFSCSVDVKFSKFQISNTRGKVLCRIPKREDGTVGELVIRNPGPVPFHALPLWDAKLDDLRYAEYWANSTGNKYLRFIDYALYFSKILQRNLIEKSARFWISKREWGFHVTPDEFKFETQVQITTKISEVSTKKLIPSDSSPSYFEGVRSSPETLRSLANISGNVRRFLEPALGNNL